MNRVPRWQVSLYSQFAVVLGLLFRLLEDEVCNMFVEILVGNSGRYRGAH